LPLAAAAAGVASLVCASLSGHAWTAPSKALAVPVDLAHLVAVAVWLGGLVGLAVVLRRAADPPALVRWFSAAALVSVAVVVVTGTISGVVQVRTLDGLTSTGYGQLLLAKVAGFGVLVAFGAYHRRVLLPRVEQLVARLGRSLHAEIGVAVAVLAVTAVLINQPPARDADADGGGPVDVTVTSEDGAATLQATVDPAEAGPNDLHLYFSDGAGAELVVNAVEVTAAIDDIPPRRLDVTPITPSHVSVLDASLTTPGLWALEVVAVTATATEATTFTLEVPIR
jgi:copper transport protein